MQHAPTPVHGPAINVAIASARLRLEPLAEHHAAPLFDGLRDPAIYEWISLQPSPDLAHLQAHCARVARFPLVGVDVLDFGWAVQRVADGAWIGKMDAEVTARGVATNVGYLFVPAYWGQGYASEAVAALGEHLRRSASTCGAMAWSSSTPPSPWATRRPAGCWSARDSCASA